MPCCAGLFNALVLGREPAPGMAFARRAARSGQITHASPQWSGYSPSLWVGPSDVFASR
jgi:hypothetical protein